MKGSLLLGPQEKIGPSKSLHCFKVCQKLLRYDFGLYVG